MLGALVLDLNLPVIEGDLFGQPIGGVLIGADGGILEPIDLPVRVQHDRFEMPSRADRPHQERRGLVDAS